MKKLGWSSRTIGDRLTVGPLNLALPDARGCWANVRVRLGYLVSTSPGMGLLRANCLGGCKCRSVVSRFLQLYLPFPLLEGNARRQRSLTVSPDEVVLQRLNRTGIHEEDRQDAPAATPGTPSAAPTGPTGRSSLGGRAAPPIIVLKRRSNGRAQSHWGCRSAVG